MAAFSNNSFFHVEIWFGGRLYLCANLATVLSPLAAANATLVLTRESGFYVF